jgi:hypothetical protein
LEIERFNILIDEWSVLDPTAGTSIQPEFADLLKRTFAGSNRISIKIATNRYQTRFSNRSAAGRYRGLEIDADIFEATNLDRALLTQENLDRFYEILLFKRLRHVAPAIERFDPDGIGEPDPEFIRSIFRDRRAFAELVKGAEGIPRDFVIIFKSLASHVGYSVGQLWTVRDVQQRIREKSVDGQGEMEYQSEAGQLLAPCIKDVVTTTGSRTFIVRREDVSSLRISLDELLEKRLIHEVPRPEVVPEIRDNYQMYLVDYGLWLDWRNVVGQREDELEEVDEPFDLSRVADYVVDPRGIEMHDMVRCPHCAATFSIQSRAYQMRELCPECLLEVRLLQSVKDSE